MEDSKRNLNYSTDDTKEKITIDEAIEKAGGFGRFQWIYAVIAVANFLPSSFFLYSLNLLTLKPVYLCPDEHGTTFHQCKSISEICVNDRLRDDIMLDTSDSHTLYNWITDMDMQCYPAFRSSMFGSLFWIGVVISSGILAITAKYGRRWNL